MCKASILVRPSRFLRNPSHSHKTFWNVWICEDVIQVRRDGSVVAWGDPVRGGDVTPVLSKLKQGLGSLVGLQGFGWMTAERSKTN